MNDKRAQLKIKIKTLAAEAAIIRVEERKAHGMAKWELQHHRKTVVRDEARRSLIAYQFIRRREPWRHFSDSAFVRNKDWDSVERMVRKYGSATAVNALPILKEALAKNMSRSGDYYDERYTEDACSNAA